MKKFVLVALVACSFILVLSARPAQAQLLRRNRQNVSYYDSTGAAPYYYDGTTMQSSMEGMPTYTTTTPGTTRGRIFQRPLLGRRRGYSSTSSVAYGGGYMGTPQYVSAGGTSGGYRSFYSPAESPTQATIRILLPDPNGKVTFDDATTQQTGVDRLFTSPQLESNKTYTYTVRATCTVNGKEVTRTQDIKVQPGLVTLVTFRNMAEGIPGPREEGRNKTTQPEK
jgi:uncharacterized protein (TIGR03000 family)